MRSLLMLASAIGATLLLFSGQADAQYKYTDDKGVSKTAQYKLDIPERYRDAAEWIGPTGIGKPALSAEQQRWKQREEADRRIREADAGLAKYGIVEGANQGADFQRASGVCQASVNNGARRRAAGSVARDFKAQAEADGTVNTFGTDQARFEYDKCMAGQGHPLR
jgi:hypothetical protein